MDNQVGEAFAARFGEQDPDALKPFLLARSAAALFEFSARQLSRGNAATDVHRSVDDAVEVMRSGLAFR